jgi:hypothetical protein
MTNESFHLQGRVTRANRTPLPGIAIAVVDRDPYRDDLLGVGVTDREGRFQLSFTTREFRLDAFERETRPDLRLVCSVRQGEKLVVCHLEDRPFPEQTRRLDLGDVVVHSWNDGPRLRPDLVPIPGLRDVVRLDLDDELISHALHEVVGHVERLTGWSGLLDDLRTADISAFGAEIGQVMTDAGIEGRFARGVARAIFERVVLYATFGLYSPHSHTIFLNAGALEHCNLDGLKVILGHELVHVGQFRNHPELIEKHRRVTADLSRRLAEAGDGPVDVNALLEDAPIRTHMRLIEGYAAYIQGYLEAIYPLAMVVPHRSWFDRLVIAAFRRTTPDLDHILESKLAQYTEGRAHFQAQGTGPQPQPFRP